MKALIQLILTDINMPKIDGWELALRIKALKPCVPIIALTGESPITIRPRLKGSGISQALFKPIKSDVLGDAIINILDSPRDKYATTCLYRADEDLRIQHI